LQICLDLHFVTFDIEQKTSPDWVWCYIQCVQQFLGEHYFLKK
jgi:hypothetical protein